MATSRHYIRWFEDLGTPDVSEVGGKNASLGEMFGPLRKSGVLVPEGFAITTEAYRTLVETNGLADIITSRMNEFKSGATSLERAGRAIREPFSHASVPEPIAHDIEGAYLELSRRLRNEGPSVAVRSSATSEDLPGASFAGQQETFLNVVGVVDVLEACRRCYASLFTNRAIAYREELGFDHLDAALSIGVQRMVRADKAGSGVMFTLDPDTGFRQVMVINAG